MKLVQKMMVITSAILLSTINLPVQAAPETTSIHMPAKDVRRFATVIGQIKHFYIEDISDEKLFTNAIRGMLYKLDPHSAYLDETDFKELQSATSGQFGGIGIEMIPEDGMIKVISPLDDTPASKAGIKPGDLIVRINKKLVKDMSLNEAVSEIRGKRGSTVTLTIVRENTAKPLEMKLVREKIKVKSVKGKLIDHHYGDVRISFFQANTHRELIKTIKQLNKDAKGDLRGIILDLRNNPGGLLDASIDIADVFLDARKLKKNKLIVYTKGRDARSNTQGKATKGDLTKGIPVVVLINGGSASASEIVAGALQDHHRAVIVGQTSFGKGSVQTVLPIDDKTAIKLTTALYYTPKGRSIQAHGIEPDITVSDIVIPKGAEKSSTRIDEASLSGHLKNGSSKSKKHGKSMQSKELVHKDFQLYQALIILKGIEKVH